MNEKDNSYDPGRYEAEVKKAEASSADVNKTVHEKKSVENTSAKVKAENNEDVNPVALDTKFEYVVPEETYEERLRRKSRASSTHQGNTKSATEEEQSEAEKGFIFISHRKKKRGKKFRRLKHKWRKLSPLMRFFIIVASVLLIIAIVLSSTYMILREIGRNQVHDYDDVSIVMPTEDESGNEIITVDNSGKVIKYGGKLYELNEDIISIVFIGVDDGSASDNGLQMSDAIYILTIDANTGRMVVLGVSRDMMADIDVYSDAGTFIDNERLQMAYSYAYGNSMDSRAKNTATALSRIFYGLPFNNYFAISMNELIRLNDLIGGVTLNSTVSFTSRVDGHEVLEGDMVTLYGKDAEFYIRTRDTSQLESNNSRMERQQQYIRAFLNTVIPAAKKDLHMLLVLNDEISVNADTNITASKITYIASIALDHLRSSADLQYTSLKGEITAGEFAEMNVTDEEIMRTMLDIFYKPYEGGLN